jgi:hypothetical protein
LRFGYWLVVIGYQGTVATETSSVGEEAFQFLEAGVLDLEQCLGDRASSFLEKEKALKKITKWKA